MSSGTGTIRSPGSRRLLCGLYIAIILLTAGLFAAGLSGCGSDGGTNPEPPGVTKSDCVGCHTDKAMLIATAEEDTTSSGDDTGET